jgi:anti-sigma factor ChrR (cupin superfamily)
MKDCRLLLMKSGGYFARHGHLSFEWNVVMAGAAIDVGEACSGSLPCKVLDATMRDLAL